MTRSKAFDRDSVLESAVGVFAQHGYEGTSAQMLTEAMGIGRQSIYDTFGSKWQLYIAALRRYSRTSVSEQVATLRSADALEAIRAHLTAFVASAIAQPACLGLSATSEFGCDQPEIVEISREASGILGREIALYVARAQLAGEVTSELDPQEISEFLLSQLSALKLAARGGASVEALNRMAGLALRALR